MSSDDPCVTRVQSDSICEPTWTVTLSRVEPYKKRDEPSASDLPPDVRAHFRAWLDTAEDPR